MLPSTEYLYSDFYEAAYIEQAEWYIAYKKPDYDVLKEKEYRALTNKEKMFIAHYNRLSHGFFSLWNAENEGYIEYLSALEKCDLIAGKKVSDKTADEQRQIINVKIDAILLHASRKIKISWHFPQRVELSKIRENAVIDVTNLQFINPFEVKLNEATKIEITTMDMDPYASFLRMNSKFDELNTKVDGEIDVAGIMISFTFEPEWLTLRVYIVDDKMNFVAIEFDGKLPVFFIEYTFQPQQVIYVRNLLWKNEKLPCGIIKLSAIKGKTIFKLGKSEVERETEIMQKLAVLSSSNSHFIEETREIMQIRYFE